MNWRSRIATTPVIGDIVLKVYRYRVAKRYVNEKAKLVGPWLRNSRETTNFTYDLTADNLDYLADLLHHLTRVDVETIKGYFSELQQDKDLANHIRRKTEASGKAHVADQQIRYGKRVGWYAFVRLLKPKVVIETGIDKGMGAVVLCSALLRNKAEGHEGRYYGTDINPQAGYLLTEPYSEVGKVLYGDSIESLNAFSEPIDLFINDSDHSAAYEGQEYVTIKDKLAPGAVILGDNAHVTDELMKFARANNRDFLFFGEKPKDHWYPGGGIGVAFEPAKFGS